jgi:hypothetical protein
MTAPFKRGPRPASQTVDQDLAMRFFPRFRRGAVVGLLQVGAWMDVMGLRRGRVGRQLIGEIEAALPRDGFGGEFRRRLLWSLGSFRACARVLFPRPRRPEA